MASIEYAEKIDDFGRIHQQKQTVVARLLHAAGPNNLVELGESGLGEIPVFFRLFRTDEGPEAWHAHDHYSSQDIDDADTPVVVSKPGRGREPPVDLNHDNDRDDEQPQERIPYYVQHSTEDDQFQG